MPLRASYQFECLRFTRRIGSRHIYLRDRVEISRVLRYYSPTCFSLLLSLRLFMRFYYAYRKLLAMIRSREKRITNFFKHLISLETFCETSMYRSVQIYVFFVRSYRLCFNSAKPVTKIKRIDRL